MFRAIRIFPGGNSMHPVLIASYFIASMIVIWIIMGNILCCYGLIRFRPPPSSRSADQRRRITLQYLLSNVLADLCIGLVVTPLALFQDVFYWPFPGLCWLWVSFDVMCCTASCLSLMPWNHIDRFLTIILIKMVILYIRITVKWQFW